MTYRIHYNPREMLFLLDGPEGFIDFFISEVLACAYVADLIEDLSARYVIEYCGRL